MSAHLKNITGQKFGMLTVLEMVRGGDCRCQCDCGAQTVKKSGNLRSGNTTSCGCARNRLIADAFRTHGEAGKTPEYRSWSMMLNRCENPTSEDYPNYGGRGITVCSEWHSYERFLADMGRRPGPQFSINRKSNDGNYEPTNCVWATPTEQARNTRRSRFITAFGETLPLVEWSNRTGIPKTTIWNRLRAGKSPERALEYGL